MPSHKGTQPIETPRLLLRRIRREDAHAMLANWAGDPEVTRFLTWQPHADLSVTEHVIDLWCDAYESPTFYQWVIVPHEGKQPIGTISVVHLCDDIASAEIGYCIGRAWWHRGFTSEALHAVIDYLFHEVGIHRVEAKHDINNPHSGGVMRKCGMHFEGISRAADRNNRGICDVARYALLRSDRK